LRISSPVIVTISNEYGSGALAIASRAAQTLGYDYVDRQLPVVVAKRLRVTPEAVEASEDSPRSLGERLIDSLERATPELAEAAATQPLDEELVQAIAQAVREAASGGRCVIVGRGAYAILGERPDVLRVFMHAPRDWRIAHVVKASNVSLEVAQAEVDRIDRARIAYIRQWYGLTFGDMRSYDLCIDTSRLDVAQSCAAIVGAVRARA
jgi:cytidylate kinase